MTLILKVVTPDEVCFEGPVVSVVAPGAEGYLGVLRGHAPLVTTMGKGKLVYRDAAGKTETLRVDGGFFQVLKNRVLVLTDKVLRS